MMNMGVGRLPLRILHASRAAREGRRQGRAVCAAFQPVAGQPFQVACRLPQARFCSITTSAPHTTTSLFIGASNHLTVSPNCRRPPRIRVCG
ncbi:hypothetical protein ACF3NW_00160 [Eikenella halliae]|uniref:hypothetical protein n=1 Tax=Eikenella halliae TaxID=1795832 RepID=UPI00370D3EAC